MADRFTTPTLTTHCVLAINETDMTNISKKVNEEIEKHCNQLSVLNGELQGRDGKHSAYKKMRLVVMADNVYLSSLKEVFAEGQMLDLQECVLINLQNRGNAHTKDLLKDEYTSYMYLLSFTGMFGWTQQEAAHGAIVQLIEDMRTLYGSADESYAADFEKFICDLAAKYAERYFLFDYDVGINLNVGDFEFLIRSFNELHNLISIIKGAGVIFNYSINTCDNVGDFLVMIGYLEELRAQNYGIYSAYSKARKEFLSTANIVGDINVQPISEDAVKSILRQIEANASAITALNKRCYDLGDKIEHQNREIRSYLTTLNAKASARNKLNDAAVIASFVIIVILVAFYGFNY